MKLSIRKNRSEEKNGIRESKEATEELATENNSVNKMTTKENLNNLRLSKMTEDEPEKELFTSSPIIALLLKIFFLIEGQIVRAMVQFGDLYFAGIITNIYLEIVIIIICSSAESNIMAQIYAFLSSLIFAYLMRNVCTIAYWELFQLKWFKLNPFESITNLFNPNIKKHVKKRGGNKKEENEEPLFNLDSLIEKFDAEYIIAAINKQNNQRSKLNKLYGITSAYIRKINKAKKRKYLPLKKYQSNILNAYSFNEKNSEESIRDLSNQFNFIREDSESIVPFPKINIKTMFNHIKNKENKEKILSVKSYINQIPEPKDEYEKEEQLIQSLRVRRKNFRNLKIKSVPNF